MQGGKTISRDELTRTNAPCPGGEICKQFLHAGGVVLDRYEHEVILPAGDVDGQHQDEQCLELTRSEFKLLDVLMRNAPKSVAEDLILLLVWKVDHKLQSNRLCVLVNQLRRKIGAEFIITVRGGYRFNTEHSALSSQHSAKASG